jgi:hypothetical protein
MKEKFMPLEEYLKKENWNSAIIKNSDIILWGMQHNLKPDQMITVADWDSCFEDALPDLYDVIDKEKVPSRLYEFYPVEVYRDTFTKEILFDRRDSLISEKWKFLFRAKNLNAANKYILKECELNLNDFYNFNGFSRDGLGEILDTHKISPHTTMSSENWLNYYKEFLNVPVPLKEVRMPAPDVRPESVESSAKMNVKSVMNIVNIAADFDWEGVFDIEKHLGYFEDVDCTDTESKNAAIERLRDSVLHRIIDFVLECEKEDYKERFLEIQHSLRIEYYDGTVMLRYQPIVYDDYD